MSSTTFESATFSMNSNEPRILFWPSTSNGVPHIPISPISSNSKILDARTALASGDNEAGGSKNFAIIGWIDQPLRVMAPNASVNPIQKRGKNVIAIGAIELLDCGEKVANRGDTSNLATLENLRAKNLVDLISASIENLAKLNPCSNPLWVSGASFSTSNCGKCKTCATFQSLRLLSIVTDATTTVEGNGRCNASMFTDQIVLYNPQKADDWGCQRCGFYSRSMQYESWEKSLLRMSEASRIFCNLVHTTNILFTQCRMNNSKTKLTEEIGMPDFPSERKLCVTSQKHSDNELSCPTPRDESMLWSHLTTQKVNLDRKPIFNGCIAEEKSWLKMSFGFLNRIPLVTATTAIYRCRKCSGNEEYKSPSTSSIIAILIDVILGFAMGIILMQYPNPILHYISSTWQNVHNRLWNDGLQWLESFPAGFKLNVALTHQMGKALRLGLLCHQTIFSYIFQADSILAKAGTTPNPSIAIAIIQYIGIFTAVMGSRFFFAFAFDMTRLGTLHIHYLSSFFSSCQRCELSTLKSLWLLFRGKKRNILRHRSDHLKYDHMQLLLGMIFFTICLFLFTTIFVYHCFFAAMNFLAEMVTCTWWCLFMFVEGGVHLERILMEQRAAMELGDRWKCRGVQLMNRVPLEGGSLGVIENAYFNHFFGNTDPNPTVANGNSTISKKISTFHWNVKANSSSPIKMNNITHVSLHSSSISVQEISFPTSSNLKILVHAFGSFAISKAKKITCVVEKFIFGKPCRIASSCLELLRRSSCLGSFVEELSNDLITSDREQVQKKPSNL